MILFLTNPFWWTDLFPIDVTIGQGHRWVVLVHGLSREAADEVGLGAVGEWQRVGEVVEVLGADWTLAVELLRLVALTVAISQI